jgi:hypothetical protein
MLAAETLTFSLFLIRSAPGYARLVRCRLARVVKRDLCGCH